MNLKEPKQASGIILTPLKNYNGKNLCDRFRDTREIGCTEE